MAPPYKTGPINDAEVWIITTADATYAMAAQRFGVTINSLRARIKNSYGSLSAARLMRDAGVIRPDRGRILAPVRRCICCGQSASMDQNQRICDACTAANAKLHDGWC